MAKKLVIEDVEEELADELAEELEKEPAASDPEDDSDDESGDDKTEKRLVILLTKKNLNEIKEIADFFTEELKLSRKITKAELATVIMQNISSLNSDTLQEQVRVYMRGRAADRKLRQIVRNTPDISLEKLKKIEEILNSDD